MLLGQIVWHARIIVESATHQVSVFPVLLDLYCRQITAVYPTVPLDRTITLTLALFVLQIVQHVPKVDAQLVYLLIIYVVFL